MKIVKDEDNNDDDDNGGGGGGGGEDENENDNDTGSSAGEDEDGGAFRDMIGRTALKEALRREDANISRVVNGGGDRNSNSIESSGDDDDDGGNADDLAFLNELGFEDLGDLEDALAELDMIDDDGEGYNGGEEVNQEADLVSDHEIP